MSHSTGLLSGGAANYGSFDYSPLTNEEEMREIEIKLRRNKNKSFFQRKRILEEKKTETKKWFEDYFADIGKNKKGSVEGSIELTKKDFLKILTDVKEFSKHFFRLFDSDDSGDVSIEEIQAGLNKLSDQGEADKKTIKWFARRFEKFTPVNGEVTQEIFLKAINKEFLIRLFGLLDIDGGGTVNLDEFKRSVDRLLMMGAEEKLLLFLENKFHESAKDTENITYEEFKKVVQNKQEYFTKKMFSICDKDKSNSISLQEFTETLEKLMRRSDDPDELEKINRDKLYFLFQIYDDNGSGDISREEMRKCIRVCTRESSLELSDVDKIADMLFDKADQDGDQQITFDEFHSTLISYIDNLEISPKGWVLPQREMTFSERCRDLQKQYLNKRFLRNNIVLILNIVTVVILYIITFAIGMWFYKDTYLGLMIAKGAGKSLNLTTVLLFLSMCRWTLTSLRNTPLGKGLALDAIVEIHKVLGFLFLFFTIIHTAAHVKTFLYNSNASIVVENGTSRVDYSFVLNAGGYFGGSYISGILLDIALLLMLVFARNKVRTGGHFTLFYWIHFITYWAIAIGTILHCKNFWKWIVIPLSIYILEKLSNLSFIRRTVYGKFYIKDYKILPSRVVELKITRPPTFNFNSGSYAFLTIPLITEYEKHPFTISSSADDKDTIGFHIKMCQGWTKKLYEELDKDDKIRKGEGGEEKDTKLTVKATHSDKDLLRYPWLKNFGALGKRKLQVYIDGPYGTPATEIFESEHAVLIAAGIGVTPFASILQTIVTRYEQSGCTCRNCGVWNDHGTFNTKIHKLDFVWITRDQKSLEWFLELLQNLEQSMEKYSTRNPNRAKKDKRKTAKPEELTNGDTPNPEPEHQNFLDIHIYLTSALSKKDFRAVGLQYALHLVREETKKDAITGLKAKTMSGRPDFNELFNNMDKRDKNLNLKKTVFFCGSPIIEEQLKVQCTKRRWNFKSEKF